MSKIIKYIFLSFLILILQLIISRLLSLGGITPDLLIIWIVYLSLRQGQTQAILWGFSIGLIYDFLIGDFIGLSAFTKMLAGFMAGYFYNENKLHLILGSYRFLLIVFFSSLIHNVIYFMIFTKGTDINLLRTFVEFGLSTSFYTMILSTLPMFMFSRKYLI